MDSILCLFHHIYHENDKHGVHHGHEHFESDYEITHCKCGKHRIDKAQAIGHDFDENQHLVAFVELCPEGGWHVESGKIISINKQGNINYILNFFHHIHHEENGHKVHHCGGDHVGFNYRIEHCQCNKHQINQPEAIGHDFVENEQLVTFTEPCPEGGWHLESGIIDH